MVDQELGGRPFVDGFDGSFVCMSGGGALGCIKGGALGSIKGGALGSSNIGALGCTDGSSGGCIFDSGIVAGCMRGCSGALV